MCETLELYICALGNLNIFTFFDISLLSKHFFCKFITDQGDAV